MVELVGLLGNQDLPLALCGTTQITTFQQRSMSLHSLKDLGIDCAHRLTQAGIFLDISFNGITHVFPLLTINGGDFVEMRIHCPPPASVASFSVNNGLKYSFLLKFCSLENVERENVEILQLRK
jgi:hypothetical protein